MSLPIEECRSKIAVRGAQNANADWRRPPPVTRPRPFSRQPGRDGDDDPAPCTSDQLEASFPLGRSDRPWLERGSASTPLAACVGAAEPRDGTSDTRPPADGRGPPESSDAPRPVRTSRKACGASFPAGPALQHRPDMPNRAAVPWRPGTVSYRASMPASRTCRILAGSCDLEGPGGLRPAIGFFAPLLGSTKGVTG